MKIKLGTKERTVTTARIWRVFYVIFAKWLPRSCYSIVCSKIRYFFTKHIVKYCGKNVDFEQNVTFGEELSVDDNSRIGFDSDIYGPVDIGKDVLIGPELAIYTNGHNFNRMDIPINKQGSSEHKKVIIEDNVWIGRRVIILGGVTVKKGSVVGAGSVVTKTFPPK